MNINADSLDVKIAKDVNIVIIVFDVNFAIDAMNVRFAIVVILTNFVSDMKKNVDIAIIDFDVISANSLDVNFANFIFDDVKKSVDVAISLEINFAISHNVNFAISSANFVNF